MDEIGRTYPLNFVDGCWFRNGRIVEHGDRIGGKPGEDADGISRLDRWVECRTLAVSSTDKGTELG